MEIKDEDIILIDAFIEGKLNEIELVKFNNRLATDISFAKDYEDITVLRAAMKSATLKGKLTLLQDYEKELPTSGTQSIANLKPIVNNSSTRWYWMAASLIGIMAAAYFLFPKQEKDLGQYAGLFGDSFSEKLILHETLRAAEPNDGLSQEQRRAYELYSIQEFDMASPLLNKLWNEKKDTLSLFYYGVSELGRGNVKVGEEVLKRSELMDYKQLIK